MLEDLEGLAIESKPLREGITDTQTAYLAELNVDDCNWADLNETQQFLTLSAVDGRMDELGVSVDQRSSLAYTTFSFDMADAYDNYLIENYDDAAIEVSEFEKPKLEAPQDHIQIEQISDLIDNCEEIKYENWVSLELPEKQAVLNALEERIAEIEHRPACPIILTPLEENEWGGYNPVRKDITINSDYVEQSDFYTYREVIDTLIHEGRHAYQDYNVNVAEIHPRHSQVVSWSETMEGGKWGYWGDCSTLLGQRLYDQQSIEIDARDFARDIMDKLNLNA